MRKAPANTNPKEYWLCEFCRRPHVGVNPPDACEICTHEFFENLHDVMEESRQATKH